MLFPIFPMGISYLTVLWIIPQSEPMIFATFLLAKVMPAVITCLCHIVLSLWHAIFILRDEFVQTEAFNFAKFALEDRVRMVVFELKLKLR